MFARTCPEPGCPHIISDGEKYRSGCERCVIRKEKAQPWGNKKRLPFYSSSRWQKLRRFMLATHPFCAVCQRVLATELDHIVSATEDKPELWYDTDNLQTICRACHAEKTARASVEARRIKNKF